MPFRQLLKSPYQYFKNRNGIFRVLKLNLRWEQWSNILIWQLFENLPKIKYFLGYVNRSVGPTIKIILSVQDHFCQTFITVRRTFEMTAYGRTYFLYLRVYFDLIQLDDWLSTYSIFLTCVVFGSDVQFAKPCDMEFTYPWQQCYKILLEG